MAKLPSVTSKLPRDLKNFLDRVREAFDNTVTRQQLESGEVVPKSVREGVGANGFETDPETGQPVAPPPAPTGLTVTGGYRTIMLEWDEAFYPGHAHTQVWAAQQTEQVPNPTIDDAFQLAIAPGELYTHNAGSSETWYYWLYHVNINNLRGPVNSADGTQGSTAVDVEYLIGELSDQISESELAQDLNSRIDLIDGPENLTGSVASRLKTEKTERTDADAALSQQITTIQAKANDNESAIQTEQTARANADSALSSDITTLQTSVGDNSTAIQQQASTQDGLSAQYTVKIDNNGAVSGFGLASTPSDDTADGSFSEFYINADRFAVLPQGDSTSNAVAPFIVDGGVVYIDSARIADGTITRAKIGSAAIDNARIANGAITSAKIANGQITNAKIDNAAIDAAQIQNGAITNAKITNAAVDSAKIEDGSINSAKIQTAAITNAKIDDAAIDRAKIQNGAIDNAKIENGSIDTAEIRNGAITNAKIATAAVERANIQDAAIDSARIQDAAVDTLQIAGQAVTIPTSVYSGGSIDEDRYDVWRTVESLTVNSTGAPINIFMSMQFRMYDFSRNSRRDHFAIVDGAVRVVRDGSVLISADLGRKSSGEIREDDSGSVESEGFLTLPYLDIPGSGSFTYRLQMKKISGLYVRASDRSLVALETKR